MFLGGLDIERDNALRRSVCMQAHGQPERGDCCSDDVYASHGLGGLIRHGHPGLNVDFVPRRDIRHGWRHSGNAYHRELAGCFRQD